MLSSYVFHQEQCPADYTRQQIESSNCIIGADIGPGLIWLLGLLSVVVAVLVFCCILISSISSNVTKVGVTLVLLGVGLIGIGIFTAPVMNSSEVYKHAKCSANDHANAEETITEYCEFPRKSPIAVVDYVNNRVIAGGILLTSGFLISGYSFLNHRSK